MAAVILIAQQLDSMFVTPLVYQQTVNLHPIVTLTSVIVGSQLLGIVGAFLAVPMVAVGWAVWTALEQPDPPPDRGHMLADVVAVIGTLDIVFGEIDR